MKHIKRIVMVLIWLIIWQIASMMTGLELLLASPVAVLRTLIEMLVSKAVLYDTFTQPVKHRKRTIGRNYHRCGSRHRFRTV